MANGPCRHEKKMKNLSDNSLSSLSYSSSLSSEPVLLDGWDG